MREDDGVPLPLEAVDLEGERRVGAAGIEIPSTAARVALDVHERAEQALGFGCDGVVGGDHAQR